MVSLNTQRLATPSARPNFGMAFQVNDRNTSIGEGYHQALFEEAKNPINANPGDLVVRNGSEFEVYVPVTGSVSDQLRALDKEHKLIEANGSKHFNEDIHSERPKLQKQFGDEVEQAKEGMDRYLISAGLKKQEPTS